jgi:glycine betaine/proline transport system ATP-binding protein
VLDNTAFGMELAGMPKAERHALAQQALEQVGLAVMAPAIPTNCRAACSSAWAWRVRWPAIRRSC